LAFRKGLPMGDISAEPSMEEILSSIKRIIAEEGDGAMAAARARRQSRPAPPPMPESDRYDDEEILELSDPVAAEAPSEPELAPEPRFAPTESAPVAAAPAVTPPATPALSLLSQRTAEATRGPLDALSRMVVKPEVAGSDTLEGMVREMIRPMLRDWLDASLPQMVESMVAREISRITGQPR
jgi:cell pole-organizing protein PopZ